MHKLKITNYKFIIMKENVIPFWAFFIHASNACSICILLSSFQESEGEKKTVKVLIC